MAKRIERCIECDEPTGRAGRCEDSIYDDSDGTGPYCEACWNKKQEDVPGTPTDQYQADRD